jgi:Uma2 family endonuclease
MTIEEFLDWPGDSSGKKFELVDGEPRAMAPASVPHGIIQANIAGILRSHLIGSRCYVVVEPGVIPRVRSDTNMRVPDLTVSCEAAEGACGR